MFLSDLEYVICRLIRKFIFHDNTANSIKKLVPYYNVTINEIDPTPIVDIYQKYTGIKEVSWANKSILEIGVGATNSVGYELCAREEIRYWGFEPFVNYNSELDDRLYRQVQTKSGKASKNSITRLNSLSELDDHSIDVVLSKSVLEHVGELEPLVSSLKRLMKDDGCMLHWVDYRDHFFKYPYHFLKYSKKTWDAFLNPGTLPRWQISDHVDIFKNHGWNVEVLYSERDEQEFTKIKEFIHPSFRQYSENDLAITQAVLFVSK